MTRNVVGSARLGLGAGGHRQYAPGVGLIELLRRRLRVYPNVKTPALPERPWFEEADALEQVDRRALDEADRAILGSWVRDGYAIADGVVPHDLIDDMVADLDGMFSGDDPFPDVVLHDLVLPDGHRAQTAHRDLAAHGRQERVAIRDRSNWRVHGFYEHSTAANAVREHPELRRIASLILGINSRADYSINFHNGSTQALHQDSAVFHLGVPNLICGAWIACEDIEEGCGPLVYYPGSHRRSMYHGFDGYPMVNLRTVAPSVTAAYEAHVVDESHDYEERTFLARKGDVLFWHGMLIHGGQPIRDAGLTRRSYVVHFVPNGADVSDQVTGPTNW